MDTIKEKVLFGWPDGGSCSGHFTKALSDLVYWELTHENDRYVLLPPEHQSSIYVHENRNTLVKIMFDKKADWLLQVDPDESFSPELLRLMMSVADAKEKPIVVGLYSNTTNHNQIGEGSFDVVDCVYAERPNGAYINVRPPDTLQPFRVDAAGTGIMLVHRSVFERLTYPYFWTELIHVRGADHPQFMNEDIAFCRVVREAGFQIWCVPLAEATHWKTIPLVPSTLRHFMATRRKAELEIVGESKHLEDGIVDHEANAHEDWLQRAMEVDGLTNEEELQWLHDRAVAMGSVVEVGTWKGRSAIALASGCPGVVWTVDHFKGSPAEREGVHKEAQEMDIGLIARRNLADYRVMVIEQESVKVAERFQGAMDMVWIDGDHDLDAVLADLQAWEPKAKRLLCGHDRDWPGVEGALKTLGLPYREGPGSIWYVEKEAIQ